MNEKREVHPYDQIRLTRQEDGSWTIILATKDGSLVGPLAQYAANIAEVADLIRKNYLVD